MRYALILILLLAPSVHPETLMRAEVQNVVPSIIGCEANLLFENAYERYAEEVVRICRNQESLQLDLMVGIEDLNSIQDVINEGMPTYALHEEGTMPDPSGTPFFLLGVNRTIGWFHANETVYRKSGPDDAYNYAVTVTANDSGGQAEMSGAGFLVREENCTAAIIPNASGTFELGDLGVTLGFTPAQAVSAPVYVRTSDTCSMPAGRQVASCLVLRSLPRFESAIMSIDIALAYPDAGNKQENTYSLWYWDGNSWNAVPGSKTDKKSNIVEATVAMFGTYAILGSEACNEHWVCGPWTSCIIGGYMTRECEEVNGCGTEEDKPENWKTCAFKPRGFIRGSTENAEILPEPIDAPVEEKDILFDINLEIIGGEIVRDDLLLFKVSLINFGDPGSVTVSLEYAIMNGSGMLYSVKEMVTLETQTEILREIDVGLFGDGRYSLVANLTYETQTEPAQAQKEFTIDRSREGMVAIWGVLLGIIAGVLVCIVSIHHRHKGGPPTDSKGSRVEKKET